MYSVDFLLFLMPLLCITIYGFLFGFFVSYIAKKKGYNEYAWFILGFLFSFLPLIAIVAIPANSENKERKEKWKRESD